MHSLDALKNMFCC